jgi:hypothetical protein
MRFTRGRYLALAGVLVAGIAVAGAGFALGRSTGSNSPNRDELAASPTPLVSTELEFDGVGFCFTPIPGLLKDGRLDPGLGGFDARYLGEGFSLAGIEFGAYCTDGRTRALKTNWLATEGGWQIMVTQAEAPQPEAFLRSPYSLSFWDRGYRYFVLALDSRGGQGGASDPTARALQPILDDILHQLAPDFREECFERSVAKDWDDLAAVGIGDPRPAIPEGFVPIRLDFAITEPPAAGCPASAAPSGPKFQFSAMFTDRYDHLLGIHIGGAPASPGYTATFQPGYAAWASANLSFNLSWVPGLIPDETMRGIARALDPTYDSICVVRSRQLTEAEIESAGFRVPEPPPGLSYMGGNELRAIAIEPADNCPPGRETGFFADWMLASDSLPGFIQVVALRGPQDRVRRPPPWDESRMIYWKDATGAEFWVSSAKAIFDRETMLAAARAADPGFEESQLAVPPAP